MPASARFCAAITAFTQRALDLRRRRHRQPPPNLLLPARSPPPSLLPSAEPIPPAAASPQPPLLLLLAREAGSRCRSLGDASPPLVVVDPPPAPCAGLRRRSLRVGEAGARPRRRCSPAPAAARSPVAAPSTCRRPPSPAAVRDAATSARRHCAVLGIAVPRRRFVPGVGVVASSSSSSSAPSSRHLRRRNFAKEEACAPAPI
ncbi:hypothetical protein PVAP13_3NG140712 [Panicum virgatum]|uniref:Uncharacterized protein n=1 Tax=Panicum virgatum TaxID=38727 RepID=A0A8T0U306_PANVG|nr:hypothetical protein PVAP13_3NG140712 [Panicum virgatum]